MKHLRKKARKESTSSMIRETGSYSLLKGESSLPKKKELISTKALL